jgi:hypothetical protein
MQPEESAKSRDIASKPKPAAAKPKEPSKKLTEAKPQVPRPSAGIPGGANAARPR